MLNTPSGDHEPSLLGAERNSNQPTAYDVSGRHTDPDTDHRLSVWEALHQRIRVSRPMARAARVQPFARRPDHQTSAMSNTCIAILGIKGVAAAPPIVACVWAA